MLSRQVARLQFLRYQAARGGNQHQELGVAAFGACARNDGPTAISHRGIRNLRRLLRHSRRHQLGLMSGSRRRTSAGAAAGCPQALHAAPALLRVVHAAAAPARGRRLMSCSLNTRQYRHSPLTGRPSRIELDCAQHAGDAAMPVVEIAKSRLFLGLLAAFFQCAGDLPSAKNASAGGKECHQPARGRRRRRFQRSSSAYYARPAADREYVPLQIQRLWRSIRL